MLSPAGGDASYCILANIAAFMKPNYSFFWFCCIRTEPGEVAVAFM